MKQIINGKKYDTDTAKKLHRWSNNIPGNDAHYCAEALYRKKTGEFFLYGEGGAFSRYSESYGDNSWGGGEKIIPLTEAEAREWMESRASADEYEEIFGECPE